MLDTREVRIPFDPETETIFCSACGTQLEKGGHITTEFMMCPNHGEFTVAPMVAREPLETIQMRPPFKTIPNPSPDAGKWFMHTDQTTAAMWQTCKSISDDT